MSISDTLNERQKTHGSFADNAYHSQRLKDLFRAGPNWRHYTPIQREALDYYACKISRILSTEGYNGDDWHDIAGYSTLVEKWIKGETL